MPLKSNINEVDYSNCYDVLNTQCNSSNNTNTDKNLQRTLNILKLTIQTFWAQHQMNK